MSHSGKEGKRERRQRTAIYAISRTSQERKRGEGERESTYLRDVDSAERLGKGAKLLTDPSEGT